MAEILYQKYLGEFRSSLTVTPDRGYQIYGLSLLYSLSDSEITREKYRLGIVPHTARDYYNLGVLANQDGHHEEAVKLYQQAMEVGGDFPDLFYNLGLSFEQLKQKAKAAEAYQKYAELCKKSDSEEVKNELRQIKAHIKMLKG